MNGILIGAVRTAIQSGWGFVASWLASVLGIVVTEEQSTTVVLLVTGAFVAASTAGIRWLETRPDNTDPDASRWAVLWPRLARRVAAWLMLGMSGAQPSYEPVKSGKR